MARRAQQILLGIAAPKITTAAARFQQETIRRGGPYEVAGKRVRGIAQQRSSRIERESEEMGEGGWVNSSLPVRLGRMR